MRVTSYISVGCAMRVHYPQILALPLKRAIKAVISCFKTVDAGCASKVILINLDMRRWQFTDL